jgi:hypothetical protein
LFVWVTGCSTYTQIGLGEITDHGKVRVTLTGGERFRLYDPVVEADSITGHEKPEGKRYATDRIIANPLDQVSAVEAISANPGGTFLVILGVVVGTLGIALAVTCISGSEVYICGN